MVKRKEKVKLPDYIKRLADRREYAWKNDQHDGALAFADQVIRATGKAFGTDSEAYAEQLERKVGFLLFMTMDEKRKAEHLGWRHEMASLLEKVVIIRRQNPDLSKFDLGTMLANWAGCLIEIGQSQKCEQVAEESLALFDALPDEQSDAGPRGTESPMILDLMRVGSLHSLIIAKVRLCKLDQAEKLLVRDVALLSPESEVVQKLPAIVQGQIRFAYGNLAALYQNRGEHAKANELNAIAQTLLKQDK